MQQAAKMKNEKPEPEETPTAQENIAPAEEDASDENFSGELNAPRWSVISFDECIASGLTYYQASDKLNELNTEKVSGLCIITDEAAHRVNEK